MTTQPSRPDPNVKPLQGPMARAVTNMATLLGQLLSGVATGNSAVKTVEIKDTATQVVSSPLGGGITGYYETAVTVEAAPDVVEKIQLAQAAALRAKADAERAKTEAQLAAAEAKNAARH